MTKPSTRAWTRPWMAQGFDPRRYRAGVHKIMRRGWDPSLSVGRDDWVATDGVLHAEWMPGNPRRPPTSLLSAYDLMCRSGYDLTCRSRRGHHVMCSLLWR